VVEHKKKNHQSKLNKKGSKPEDLVVRYLPRRQHYTPINPIHF